MPSTAILLGSRTNFLGSRARAIGSIGDLLGPARPCSRCNDRRAFQDRQAGYLKGQPCNDAARTSLPIDSSSGMPWSSSRTGIVSESDSCDLYHTSQKMIESIIGGEVERSFMAKAFENCRPDPLLVNKVVEVKR